MMPAPLTVLLLIFRPAFGCSPFPDPRFLMLALGFLLTGCSSAGPSTGAPDASDLRVLFVGNSLIYTNDLPAMVSALAEADGQTLIYETVAFPNYALMDHWQEGTARAALSDGDWDVLIMQQGPSSLPANQENLRTWTQNWAEAARAEGTEPALYMVWPSEARSADFPGVIQAYTNAAGAARAELYPVGSAWLLAWEREPATPLYGPDRFHPSPTGTYLAALVIYGALSGRAVVGLPARLTLSNGTLTIREERAQMLQEVATQALLDIKHSLR